MSFSETQQYYHAVLPTYTEKDWAQTSERFNTSTPAETMEWANKHTELFETSNSKDARQFLMVVDRGEDESKAVVVTGEFANEIKPSAIDRALAIRALAAPEASLIIQPNNVSTQWNMHYSGKERSMLRNKDLTPLVGRIGAALYELGDPDELALFGPSQGGVATLSYASRERPDAAVAVLETPNVIERSFFKMTQDFLGCGAALKEVIAANFEDPNSPAAQEVLKTASLLGLAKYSIKMATVDNLALVNILARGDAKEQMQTILSNGGSMVHAWATKDRVSPAEDNRAIRDALRSEPRYEGYEFEADHSITNAAALDGALLRRAIELRSTPIS